eukprot:scaffold165816_cov33-Tisochrysis_lutea.AAC.3
MKAGGAMTACLEGVGLSGASSATLHRRARTFVRAATRLFPTDTPSMHACTTCAASVAKAAPPMPIPTTRTRYTSRSRLTRAEQPSARSGVFGSFAPRHAACRENGTVRSA